MDIVKTRVAKHIYLAVRQYRPCTIFAALAAVVWVSGADAQTADAFTDPRDGKTYRTVKIGEQVWMGVVPSVAFATDSGNGIALKFLKKLTFPQKDIVFFLLS